jgi:hypothetical protein
MRIQGINDILDLSQMEAGRRWQYPPESANSLNVVCRSGLAWPRVQGMGKPGGRAGGGGMQAKVVLRPALFKEPDIRAP